MHMCVVRVCIYCLLGDNGRLQYTMFVEMYVNVVFVMSCLYRAVNLTSEFNSG